MKLPAMNRGQAGVLGIILAIVMGIVGLSIIVTAIANVNFDFISTAGEGPINSSHNGTNTTAFAFVGTIIGYAPVFIALGLMALGAYGLIGRRG